MSWPRNGTLRVLMTADTVGGVWTYALELVAALRRHDVAVVLATMGAPLRPEQRAAAEKIPNLAIYESDYALEWMDEPWADVDAAGEWLLDLERRLAPNLIHLNGYAHGALPWSAPVAMVAHSCVLSWWQAVKGEDAPSEWDEYRRRVRAGLAGADVVAAPTAAMLAAIERCYPVAIDGRVIHNGRSAGLAPAPKEPFILSAGRLWDEAKNLAALDACAGQLPWPVCVAGPVERPGGGRATTGAVTMLGPLPPDHLAEQMARASIYTLPARYEPFGLSVLEAAQAGCALVLGDIETLRELWDGAARFVSPGDAAALGAALEELIADPAQRADLAHRARERARRFPTEAMGRAYAELYAELLRDSRRVRAEGTRPCAS